MKILIVKTSSLGDIIHCFPTLSYLRKRFPKGQIDWVVESKYASILEGTVARPIRVDTKNRRLGELRSYRAQLGRYDVAFDLQGNCKSGILLGFVKAKQKVGFAKPAEWPNRLFTRDRIAIPKQQNIRQDYLAMVQGYFRDPHPFVEELGQTPRGEEVLVCPSSRWPNKCLSQEQLETFLPQIGGPFFFAWGSEEEKRLCESVCKKVGGEVLPKLSLLQLKEKMKKCRLVVAMDSLALHLCGTTSTPTLSFFGPSSAAKYAPQGEQHHVISGSCPYGIVFEKRCPKLRSCKSGACLKQLDEKCLDSLPQVQLSSRP